MLTCKYYHQGALQIRRAKEQGGNKKQTLKQRKEAVKKQVKLRRQRTRRGQGAESGAEDEDAGDHASADDEADDSTAAAGAADDKVRFWLSLSDSSAKEKGGGYGKKDLWLLSNDALFGWQDGEQQQPVLRYSKPWVAFVISEYRSFAERNGAMLVHLLAVEGSTAEALPFSKSTNVYGIRALSIGLEIRNDHNSHQHINNSLLTSPPES